jgi:hypothetical protein
VREHRPQPFDELGAVYVARAISADLEALEVGWKSRFHCDERQVAQYRHSGLMARGVSALAVIDLHRADRGDPRPLRMA